MAVETHEIKKLSDFVINKIAAGEVIQRPANAIKEMLENSLDAKSTSITITVKDGGLKYLQIHDNGIGIRKEDMEIVCERFTTSKLSSYEDLSHITTYGFRGEALASISHVAHVTIVTRTNNTLCAYKGSYNGGKLKAPIRACAGNVGTQITVEDLFYNVPIRKNSLKNANEELQKIVDIVSKYAIHNPHAGFLVKKQGEIQPDIKTVANCIKSENIKIIYGSSIAKELLEIDFVNDQLHFQMNAIITNANYNTKKKYFLLFINHRLVDCLNLRRGIENIYATYLPKNTFPFVYISLELPASNIDVNVHPTKQEVHFIHEDEIILSIQRCIDAKLFSCNSSRTYIAHNLLPNRIITHDNSSNINGNDKMSQKDLVRTDCKDRTLDSFLSNPQLSSSSLTEKGTAMQQEDDDKTFKFNTSLDENKNKYKCKSKLTSVLQLIEEIVSNSHEGLKDIFQKHSFVGCIDSNFALIQYQTRLYLVNVEKLSMEFFYQLFIYNFGAFGIMKLSEEASLFELAMLGLDEEESGWSELDGRKEDLANYVANLLTDKREMLNDYFSIQISDEGNLKTLPLLLDNFVPNFARLPIYILRLATEVDWENEKNCFRSFARETSRFYATMELTAKHQDTRKDEEPKTSSVEWMIEHCIFSTIKSNFQPPKSASDDATILQLANLPDLYKVFERC